MRTKAYRIFTKKVTHKVIEYDCRHVSTYIQCNSPADRATKACSSHKRRGGCRVVFERRRDLLLRLVVARKAVNTGFDQDQTEFGVLVLPVGFEVLANSNSLLHEVPEVLGDGGSKCYIRISGYQPMMSRQRH